MTAMYSTILCKKFAAIRDLSRSLNVDVVGVLSKNFTLGTTFAHQLFSRDAPASPGPGKRQSPLPRPNADGIGRKYYCKNYRPFPEVPEFPPVVWPNLFKSVKALLYSYLIIKPQYDKDFSLQEFSKNSRLAVGVVSGCIARRDFSTLQGLVTKDVLEQIESIALNLDEEEVKDMAFDEDDIYLYLPIQLDIFNDAKLQDRRYVEITMCYHAIHNLEEIKKRSEEIDIQKELKSSIYVLNYRFIREYTEGVKDAWTINAINHLKAEEHDKTIL